MGGGEVRPSHASPHRYLSRLWMGATVADCMVDSRRFDNRDTPTLAFQ